MVKRIVVEKSVNPEILGDKLVLPTSKKITKNRFLKSALSEYAAFFTPDNPETHGLPTQVHVNMYEKWSAGGFGITVTGNVIIDQNHLEAPGNTIIQKELDSPAKRKIWKEIAENAKKHGSLIVAQLGHAGRQTPKFLNPKPFSSSTVALKNKVIGREFGDPIELTTEQIKTEVIDKFVFTSKFLFDAGFDGIQIHGAHGYLIAQFLSRTTNKRTDKYGGSAKNRAQILVDIYNAIRQEIPAQTGFIIGAKLNSVEFQNEGLSTNEAQEVVQTLDETGFDFLELSGGTYEKLAFEHVKESTIKREAYFAEFAGQIKPTVKNSKIYLTGGFRTVPAMVAAINDGITDGIGFGRPATQDFDFPNQILNRTIESAGEFPFNHDIAAGVLACSLQMSQAGQKSLTENSNINEGIMDLSDKKTVQEYLDKQTEFILSIVEAGQEGKIKYGLVPYKLEGFVGGLFDSKKLITQKVSNF